MSKKYTTIDDDTNKLTPCPFCGEDPVFDFEERKHGVVYSIFCPTCGAEIARLNKEDVFEAWSKRTTIPYKEN